VALRRKKGGKEKGKKRRTKEEKRGKRARATAKF
jgi:hypothetical protein